MSLDQWLEFRWNSLNEAAKTNDILKQFMEDDMTSIVNIWERQWYRERITWYENKYGIPNI